MNEVTTPKELSPNTEMKYKLRFITMHEGQRGGFQGNEEETEDKDLKLIILDSFVILQNRNGAKSMMKMLR